MPEKGKNTRQRSENDKVQKRMPKVLQNNNNIMDMISEIQEDPKEKDTIEVLPQKLP